MDINKIKEIMYSYSNVSEFLDKHPDFRDSLFNALNGLYASDKISYNCHQFFASQEDIIRYVEIAKKYASTKFTNKNKTKNHDSSLEDKNAQQLVIHDAIGFYYFLDKKTNNKFNLLKKVEKILPIIEFSPEHIRPAIQTKDDKDGFSYRILSSTYPTFNNRIATVHEIYHALDSITANGLNFRTNLPPHINPYSLRYEYMQFNNPNMSHDHIYIYKPDYHCEEFVFEIGTMIIDKINIDYLKELYKRDEKFCAGMDALKESRKSFIFKKSANAYLDYLFALSIAGGNEYIKEYGFNEIVSNIGKLWNGQDLLDKLDDIIETEQSNSPYIPMCEMRYVVGEAIALTVYDKYCQANNSRFKLIRDKKVNEILSSVINLNNNLHNIESLKPSNSDANNKIDIITDYFQIDRLEKLLEHRTEEILNKEKNNC